MYKSVSSTAVVPAILDLAALATASFCSIDLVALATALVPTCCIDPAALATALDPAV
jgi:hypothetical protein